MFNPHEARAERHDLRQQARVIVDAAIASGKDLSGAELKKYNDLLKQMDGVQARLDRYEAHLPQLDQPDHLRFVNIQPERTPVANGLKSHLREIYNRATMGQREQIDGIVAYLAGRSIAASGADLTPGGDGGVLIPSFVVPTLERNYSAFAPVVSVARLWPTDDGAPTVFPVLSDSESAEQVEAAAATGADATVSGDTPPTDLTGPLMGAYKISSKPVFVPRETFTDSALDIVEEIVGALLARIIRLENSRYTSGTGVGQAEGFLTKCCKYAAGAVALDLDICLDLAYAVPQLYRPRGVYQMSDDTAKFLRKLKTGLEGDKRQLWADADATKGTPATLHGYPVIINNDMDSVGTDGKFADKSPVAFGDFKRFVVRQGEQNQPYAYRYSVPARDGSAVILFRRTDSKLLVPEAICKLVVE